MARRMDIELTSQRDDDTWTWRAAGARQPKGTLDAALLPPATKVGDVVRAEVEGFLDGLTVVAVLPPKAPRAEPERLELLTPRSGGDRLVTTSTATRPGRGRTERPRRGERPARGERDRDHGRRRPERERGRDRGDRRDRERGEREPAPSGGPAPDAKPKPKRLRPAKVHRTALLEALPAEQRPIAEQLLQGGIPAVRQAIDKQNESLKSEGKPQVNREPLLEIAEKIWPRVQAATWRDRADAALAHVDDLDLRDLRSVVNAAEDAGRDEEARNLAHQLREALANRVEKEQAAWVSEVADNLREGRVVRALRLTSRPPKAGSPVPPDLAEQLVVATGEALTAETGPQRWATVLDALAYSPIRRRVVPASLPEKLAPDLRETIARLATRLPEIAHIFDITPAAPAGRPARPARRRGGKKGERPGGGGGAATTNGQAGRERSRGGRDKGGRDKPDRPATQPTDTEKTPDEATTDEDAPTAPVDEQVETVTTDPETGTPADAEQAEAVADEAETDDPGGRGDVAETVDEVVTTEADEGAPADRVDAEQAEAVANEAETGTPSGIGDATEAVTTDSEAGSPADGVDAEPTAEPSAAAKAVDAEQG